MRKLNSPSVERRGKNIARLEHADDILDCSIGNRDPGMRGFKQRLPDFFLARIDVDPVDFGPRGHHFANGPVGQANDAGNHRPLFLLEDACRLGFGNDQMQLFGGDLVLRFAIEADEAENELA